MGIKKDNGNGAPQRWRRRPLTLIELVIASGLTLLAAGGIYQSMIMSKVLSQLDAQHIAAMSLCQDKLEELRGLAWEGVDSTVFDAKNAPGIDALAPFEERGLTLTHTEANETVNLQCNRLSEVSSFELAADEVSIKGGRRRGWENLAPGLPNVNWNQHGKGGRNNSIYKKKGSEDPGAVYGKAKYVVIAVTWEYLGRPQVEMLEGVIYDYSL